MGIHKIGRYEIIRELGRGGMATVFLARDPAFGRQVAVKVLPPQLTRDAHYLLRFRREAKVIAALEHAYIVPVYDYGEDEGQPFLVMRHMPGGTLLERMGGKPMAPAEVAPLVTRIAEALDVAHSQGIIHRDLKPSNVLFDAHGQPHLSDFGIAKILEDVSADSLTGSGVVGTPAYMSPEQAMGDKVIDHRSDIYALGVMVYEMLTGRPPYQADTPMRLLLKHISEPTPQLQGDELRQLGLSHQFNDVLNRALAKKPQERYASATDLAKPLYTLATLPGVRVESSAPPTLSVLERRARQESVPAAPIPVTPPSQPGASTIPSLSLAAWQWFGGGALVVLAVVTLLGVGVWVGSNFNAQITPTPTVTLASSPSSAPAAVLPSATQAATATANPTHTVTPTSTLVPASETPTAIPPSATATRRPVTRVPPTNTAPPPTLTNTPQPSGDNNGDNGSSEPTLAPP